MADLFIPEKIKIGFVKRKDTFTGKLAFVTYFDEKGILRQEKTWNNWRDKSIEVVDFANKPRTGYILNKGIQRSGYWGSGRSVIRVYDDRDFEFEITLDNLLGILMHSDVSRRDISEQCIFAWSGKKLVLLPVNSEEYQQSVQFTKKQSENLTTKELLKGYSYNQKKNDQILIYIGYEEWKTQQYVYAKERYGYNNYSSGKYQWKKHGKKHVFYNLSDKCFVAPAITALSSVHTEQIVDDYAFLLEKFVKDITQEKGSR